MQRKLRRIGDAAERATDLARALTSYARPSEGPPGPIELRSVLNQAIVFCEHTIASSHVVLRIDVPASLPRVLGLSAKLTQAFVNLITNACHAMAPGGGALSIRAHASTSQDTVIVSVADTGPGIPSPYLPRIFEPFFTTKPQGVGVGLGLSIVRHIVHTHRGSIDVESAEGVGTVFHVTLPAAVSPSED